MSMMGKHCSVTTCPLSMTFFGYRPNLAINDGLLTVFAVSLVAFIVQAFMYKKYLSFSIAMIVGCLTEVSGYAGRLILYVNPFSQFGFILQMCALTLAPAFFSAGIYICLAMIVSAFGPQHSRITPKQYMWIFIPSDLIALTLQGTGGGMASIAYDRGQYSRPGNKILLAGLVAQVVSLAIFMLLAIDFMIQIAIRARRNDIDARVSRTLSSKRFKGFVMAITVSTLLIFARSIFRIKEKQGGWTGKLMKNQLLFVIFEGILITIACCVFNFWHPGYCMETLDEDDIQRISDSDEESEKVLRSREIMESDRLLRTPSSQNTGSTDDGFTDSPVMDGHLDETFQIGEKSARSSMDDFEDAVVTAVDPKPLSALPQRLQPHVPFTRMHTG